jgi:hypothetical protein
VPHRVISRGPELPQAGSNRFPTYLPALLAKHSVVSAFFISGNYL